MIEEPQESVIGSHSLPPGREERRELVESVLASELFRKAPKLSSFLRFICEQEDTGNARAIHEQVIGVKVFERRPGYSVGDDSIVRSQARLLRQRLEEYFAKEGRNQPLILTIPKGSYVPTFERREVMSDPGADLTQPAPKPSPVLLPASYTPRNGAPRWVRYAGLAAVALLFAGGIARFVYPRRGAAEASGNLTSLFWNSIFQPNRSTIIVPSDSSLVVMEQLRGGPVHVQGYSTKEYLKNDRSVDPRLWDFISESQYTNVADLNFVSRLLLLPQAAKSRPEISYARDLSIKELKDGNSVLIGGAMANPWVELFAPSVHFDVDFDWTAHHGFVNNRAPAGNEKSRYAEVDSGKDGEYEAFGVIAYLPSLGGQGHSLLVEGTSKAGTEAAAEFLASETFAQFLAQIANGGRTLPNFELLLSTRSLRGASHASSIVSWHKLGSS